MKNFSSLQFMEIFTKGKFSINVRASQLQSGNDFHEDFNEAITNIVNLVNNDGGWTIYGWGKRGMINDASLVGNDSFDDSNTKVIADETTIHVVHIHPTDKKYLDSNDPKGKALINEQVDLSLL